MMDRATASERRGTLDVKLHWASFSQGKLLSTVILILSWLIPLALLAWAVRLSVVEGYLYPARGDFAGDFTRTADLGTIWWTGSGIFYGPIFVLEYLYLLAPNLLTGADFARLDYVLFGLAFLLTWVALFGAVRPRLAILVLALWLVHHASVEAFSNTAHLEVLEFTFLCAALLLAVRERLGSSGVTLGLAVATKTLPALFVPYLALKRQWRMLIGMLASGGILLLIVCWIQQISPWDAVLALIYQGGNLTKVQTTEYEYTLRADFARILAPGSATLTDEDAWLAIGLHWAVAIAAMLFAAWAFFRVALDRKTWGLAIGLISALMLVVAPSAHVAYYIFLLPAWTAMLAELLRRPLTRLSIVFWAALVGGYTFTGFDQPFFLSQRLFGFGRVVPENWLPWHLPTLALLLTVAALGFMLLTMSRPSVVPSPEPCPTRS
jgi:hypothetical protein